MGIRDRALAGLAAQLGDPRGVPGRIVGRMLNRANRAATRAAVDSLDITPEVVLADLGFGGGVGLALLLGRLGKGGQVHGVDRSSTMVAAAARRFRDETTTGRLALHRASIERLPLATASVAITVNTLYFVTDLATAFNEFARVLKPSGKLAIGLGDPDSMAREPLTAHGFHVRPLVVVTEALRDAGLEVDQHRRVGAGTRAFHLLVVQWP